MNVPKIINFVQRGTKAYFNIASYADGSDGYSYDDLENRFHPGIQPDELYNKIVVQDNKNITVYSRRQINNASLLASLGANSLGWPGAELFTIATSAIVTSTIAGTYDIVTGTSDQMKIAVDGAAPVTITLTGGAARTAAQVCTDINTALGATIATVSSGGMITLTSTTFGTSSQINIENPASHPAYTVLGFTVAATLGTAGTQVV